ncbi:MAG: hypothetical protein AAF715_07920 [Myxococcota bacterium]
MATLIGHGIDRGWVDGRDVSARQLAEQLAAMWKGFRYSRAQFGLTDQPFADIDTWAEHCLATLLDGRARTGVR